ncbi:GvpL/GvpF family gas vesicle protein [Patescibacteria group bacterium]|nr:GvpL/GvpF family gas vesicle protein [Patescibacteria group bacterium]
MEEGKYIYCIIQGNENRSWGQIGINNQKVNLVHYKDISAVVSNTPVINFDRLDKEELVKYVASHQEVNEKAMKEYDVVPMTFGIIAPSVSEVARILEKAYLQFKTALKNITGKAEFVVQVWWNPQKILEELANTNPEIRRLKQEVALKVNILGIPTRLKLGKLIQKETEIQRQTFINDVQALLRDVSLDSTSNKLIDKEMLANLSLLIEKAKESELDKKMQELGKKYEGKLRFKYIGPMPSYSFVKINLGLGNFELLNEARKLLGLAEEVSFDEIKRAYYELSHRYHPDRFQGNEEQMKKIAQAHRLLENYCESCDEFSPSQILRSKTWEGKGKIEKYSLKKEDVENSIMIK